MCGVCFVGDKCEKKVAQRKAAQLKRKTTMGAQKAGRQIGQKTEANLALQLGDDDGLIGAQHTHILIKLLPLRNRIGRRSFVSKTEKLPQSLQKFIKLHAFLLHFSHVFLSKSP